MKIISGWIIGLVFGVSAWAEPLLEGQVRLASGEPVPDAQVRLFDMTDLERGAVARAMTDGTGYFALPLAALGGRALPARFALGPNYPNPFNPSTLIPYQLAASAQVRLEVFNLLGQHLATLVDGERSAGFHTATWTATDAAGRAVGAGVYIYRMTVGAESQTGRMVLLDGQAGVSAGGTAFVMPSASGVGESAEGVYGLIVSGSGLIPYVDSSFRVESGMSPVELVVSSGEHSAGKATDDDCAFCDLFGAFNDQQEEEETEEEEEETDSTSSEGGPDLIVQSPSVSASMLTPGQAFTLQATVHNQGDAQAAATMLHYYRSNNATITASDTEVGTDAIDALDASATRAASIALTAPTGGAPEVYYGACVASVGGESNTDNNCSSAVKITVSGQVATPEEEEDDTPEEEETPEEETPEEEEKETPEEEGADGQVTIPDAKLRAAIAAALGKARGATITKGEMTTLLRLEAHEEGISDLTGLEFATNLTTLNLGYNNITDISPLAGLTNLIELDLSYNTILDVSALSNLTNLRALDLWSNNISDVSGLGDLTNLQNLFLGYNNISDVSVLRDLTDLKRLGIRANNISDVSVLRGMTNLEWLDFGLNNVADVSVLEGLTKLWHLSIRSNNISDVSVLRGLTNLEILLLGANSTSDISMLGGLTKLQRLWLENASVSDISALGGLTELRDLNLTANDISDISALGGLTKLEILRLWFNNISDVSSLRGLAELQELWLTGNPLSDSSINDHIPILQSHGVTVRFDSFRIMGDFDVELVFLVQFTVGEKNILRSAARRWMSVVSGDLPDYEFTQRWSGNCGDQSYVIPAGERIDDLRIYVTSFDGGGPVVGWGSPHLLRETHLPVLGCMGFDLKWANLWITGLHEIGHVLGFGPIWDDLGLLQNPNGDAHFNGRRAIAAFNDAGGRNYTGAKVPVETDRVHWRNSVFPGELMRSGGGGALSATTVQSLADLGYGVDVTQADPFTLPDAAGKASAKIAATIPSISGVDVTLADVYTLPSVGPHWKGRIAGRLPLLFGDDRLRGRPESTEWIGDRGVDLRDNRLMGHLAPSSRAVPELLCGAGLRQEPIYVVDEQGYIIHILGD